MVALGWLPSVPGIPERIDVLELASDLEDL